MKLKIPLLLAGAIGISVTSMTTFNVLDTFVFEKPEGDYDNSINYDWDTTSSSNPPLTQTGTSSSAPEETSSVGVSESSEESSEEESGEKTTVELIEGTRKIGTHDVKYHLVDIKLKKLSDLRARLATDSSGKYGTNTTQSFSSLINSAESVGGKKVLAAISGDYPYWSGRRGYVVRDGVAYRSNRRNTVDDDFAIFKDGTVMSFYENDFSVEDLEKMHGGVYQTWSFGPTLLMNGNIQVNTTQEIDGQTMSNNQRSAIGYAGDNHFYFLNCEVDGSRNSKSHNSFSLYEMAEFFQELGCINAYNLDGGDSVGIYIGNQIVVQPERKLGDIIYVVNS